MMDKCDFCGVDRGDAGRLRVCCEEGAKADHYPLPESAVELAVEAVIGAGRCDCCTTDDHRANVRAALEAALPAIREAVVGEILALADEIEKSACRAPLVINRSAVAFTPTTIDSWTAKLRNIAALTEQENRNDLERSHDGG